MEKRKVKFLYIEADEDHVLARKGRNMHVHLVYVHEGRGEKNGRRQLINPHYFAGCYDLTDDLRKIFSYSSLTLSGLL